MQIYFILSHYTRHSLRSVVKQVLPADSRNIIVLILARHIKNGEWMNTQRIRVRFQFISFIYLLIDSVIVTTAKPADLTTYLNTEM